MAEKKRIVILCGAGFATSTAGEAAIAKICKEIGVEADIQKRQVREAKSIVGKVDLYVLMSQAKLELDAPAVKGICFISGIGKQAAIDEIKKILTAE